MTEHIRPHSKYEYVMDADGVAALFGITVEQAKGYMVGGRPMYLPEHMTRQGRRRTREAFAATGSDFIGDAIDYWIAKEGR